MLDNKERVDWLSEVRESPEALGTTQGAPSLLSAPSLLRLLPSAVLCEQAWVEARTGPQSQHTFKGQGSIIRY